MQGTTPTKTPSLMGLLKTESDKLTIVRFDQIHHNFKRQGSQDFREKLIKIINTTLTASQQINSPTVKQARGELNKIIEHNLRACQKGAINGITEKADKEMFSALFPAVMKAVFQFLQPSNERKKVEVKGNPDDDVKYFIEALDNTDSINLTYSEYPTNRDYRTPLLTITDSAKTYPFFDQKQLADDISLPLQRSDADVNLLLKKPEYTKHKPILLSELEPFQRFQELEKRKELEQQQASALPPTQKADLVRSLSAQPQQSQQSLNRPRTNSPSAFPPNSSLESSSSDIKEQLLRRQLIQQLAQKQNKSEQAKQQVDVPQDTNQTAQTQEVVTQQPLKQSQSLKQPQKEVAQQQSSILPPTQQPGSGQSLYIQQQPSPMLSPSNLPSGYPPSNQNLASQQMQQQYVSNQAQYPVQPTYLSQQQVQQQYQPYQMQPVYAQPHLVQMGQQVPVQYVQTPTNQVQYHVQPTYLPQQQMQQQYIYQMQPASQPMYAQPYLVQMGQQHYVQTPTNQLYGAQQPYIPKNF